MMKASSYLLCTALGVASLSALPPGKKMKFIDPANMDLSVKPGDNFFRYANGNWLAHNPVPASKTRWGSFDGLRQTSLDRLKILCEEAAANPSKSEINQKVGDLYAAAMDSVAIEGLGFNPIKKDLDLVDAINNSEDLLRQVTTLRTSGTATALFGFRVEQDDRNVNKYISTLSQGGTSLPDRDYYFKSDARSILIRSEFLKYMADMFVLVGEDRNAAVKKAQFVLGLETGLAKAQLSRTEMRDPVKLYNKFSLSDFSKYTPGLSWPSLFANMKVTGADSLLVNNPSFFKTADAMVSSVPLEVWKAYLQWTIIRNNAHLLSQPFVSRQFEFNRVLTGQKQIAPRWQRMSALVDADLGELLGQLYVQQYFTDSSKKRMLDLVQNVQQTFNDRIGRLNWMTDETKQKAILKLHAIVNKIGFPDKWEKYEGTVIKRDDLIGSAHNVAAWDYMDMVSKLGKPVDKTKWGMSPPTINAYYNPTNNEIAFPAGILQFPFFDFNADDAVNYGGIAAVIGHELTHGFDDEGRQYAADGNLQDWWSSADAKQFNDRADKVVSQYDAFTVNDTIHVNGRLTLGENLADLGGLNIAYEAFKKTAEGKTTKKIDGFTPDQRFFLSWAQIWRSNIRPESAAQYVLTDPHSPAQYRCNAPVSNIDAWYTAFDVKEGDKMFKPASARIHIW